MPRSPSVSGRTWRHSAVFAPPRRSSALTLNSWPRRDQIHHPQKKETRCPRQGIETRVTSLDSKSLYLQQNKRLSDARPSQTCHRSGHSRHLSSVLRRRSKACPTFARAGRSLADNSFVLLNLRVLSDTSVVKKTHLATVGQLPPSKPPQRVAQSRV